MFARVRNRSHSQRNVLKYHFDHKWNDSEIGNHETSKMIPNAFP